MELVLTWIHSGKTLRHYCAGYSQQPPDTSIEEVSELTQSAVISEDLGNLPDAAIYPKVETLDSSEAGCRIGYLDLLLINERICSNRKTFTILQCRPRIQSTLDRTGGRNDIKHRQEILQRC